MEVVGPVARGVQRCFHPIFQKGNLMAAVTMTANQKFTITILPVDAKGNKAKIDGVPTWLTDDSNVLTLTPAADGLSCDVIAVGIAGTATVQVEADADLGPGITLIRGTLDVECTALPATNIVLTPGPLSDQS